MSLLSVLQHRLSPTSGASSQLNRWLALSTACAGAWRGWAFDRRILPAGVSSSALCGEDGPFCFGACVHSAGPESVLLRIWCRYVRRRRTSEGSRQKFRSVIRPRWQSDACREGVEGGGPERLFEACLRHVAWPDAHRRPTRSRIRGRRN